MGGSVEGSRTRFCFLMSVDNNSCQPLFRDDDVGFKEGGCFGPE